MLDHFADHLIALCCPLAMPAGVGYPTAAALATHVRQATRSLLVGACVSGAAHWAVHGIVPLCITGLASNRRWGAVSASSPDHVRITF